MACQRQIVRIIGAAVLLRHDMFNVVDQFAIPLVEPALFATLGSPLPDEGPASPYPFATESSSPVAAAL
jgi:hypothetical protein